MTKEQLAAMLDGSEYGNEIISAESDLAAKHGLVVVFGYSDDNVEFRGAIRKEVEAGGGAIIHLDKCGIYKSNQELANCKTIEAIWCEDEGAPAWTYKTDIPHATFDIYDDGEVFCRGIIFEMAALEG